jgi:hypothetical protein
MAKRKVTLTAEDRDTIRRQLGRALSANEVADHVEVRRQLSLAFRVLSPEGFNYPEAQRRPTRKRRKSKSKKAARPRKAR